MQDVIQQRRIKTASQIRSQAVLKIIADNRRTLQRHQSLNKFSLLQSCPCSDYHQYTLSVYRLLKNDHPEWEDTLRVAVSLYLHFPAETFCKSLQERVRLKPFLLHDSVLCSFLLEIFTRQTDLSLSLVQTVIDQANDQSISLFFKRAKELLNSKARLWKVLERSLTNYGRISLLLRTWRGFCEILVNQLLYLDFKNKVDILEIVHRVLELDHEPAMEQFISNKMLLVLARLLSAGQGAVFELGSKACYLLMMEGRHSLDMQQEVRECLEQMKDFRGEWLLKIQQQFG